MDNISDLIRTGRRELGLSTRSLASLAGVSYPTISRIENGHEQPRLDTLEKIATALGKSLRPMFEPLPMLRLCDLADQWTYDATGEAQPAWTPWRAFADQVTVRPYLTAPAIAPAPAPSGSEFVDNLLAGTAEKLADDTGIRRPSWTLRIPPLRTPWRALGTPRMRADHATRTPPQVAARNITLPATSIWRDREMALAWPNPSQSAARRSGSSSPRSAANSTKPADLTP